MALNQITQTAAVAKLYNLEDDSVISFDSISPGVEGIIGSEYSFVSLVRQNLVATIYQGSKGESYSLTGYFDRYWQAESVQPIIKILQQWQEPTKNKVPPIIAYQHGGTLISPCILQDIRIKTGGLISGVPTRLEVSFTLVKVDKKNLVL